MKISKCLVFFVIGYWLVIMGEKFDYPKTRARARARARERKKSERARKPRRLFWPIYREHLYKLCS